MKLYSVLALLMVMATGLDKSLAQEFYQSDLTIAAEINGPFGAEQLSDENSPQLKLVYSDNGRFCGIAIVGTGEVSMECTMSQSFSGRELYISFPDWAAFIRLATNSDKDITRFLGNVSGFKVPSDSAIELNKSGLVRRALIDSSRRSVTTYHRSDDTSESLEISVVIKSPVQVSE